MLEKVDYGGKGMTDKQLIETLRNIKQECLQHIVCVECVFEKETVDGRCHIMQLLESLADDAPHKWDMDKIERIINE